MKCAYALVQEKKLITVNSNYLKNVFVIKNLIYANELQTSGNTFQSYICTLSQWNTNNCSFRFIKYRISFVFSFNTFII